MLAGLVVLVEAGHVGSMQINLRLAENHPLGDGLTNARTFLDPHGCGRPQTLDLGGLTENRCAIGGQGQQSVARVLLADGLIADDVRHELHRVLVLKVEVFLGERHFRWRESRLLVRGNLVRFVQDRAVGVRANLQTRAVLPLVHEGVHVSDDRPLDIALSVGEERYRADVLHLVDGGRQRNRGSGHRGNTRAPATAGNNDVLGLDGAAVGDDGRYVAVRHLDVEDLGVRHA